MNSTACPYDEWAFSPLDFTAGFGFPTWLWRDTCLLLISMLWQRKAIFESKGDKLSSSAESRIRTWKSQGTLSPADWMPTHKPTEPSRIKLKTWTQQPVPMRSEHSAHLTSLPFLAFAPGSGDIHVCCCLFRCSGTGKRYSNLKVTRCLPLLKAGFEPGSLKAPNRQQTDSPLTKRLSYRGSS